MSTANFRTQDNFPLYAFSDEVFYSKALDEDGNEIEDSEPEYDEFEAEDFVREIQESLGLINKLFDFYKIELRDGYYDDLQFYVTETQSYNFDYDDPDNDDAHYYCDCCRSVLIRKIEREQNKVCKQMKKLASYYGFKRLHCDGIFSNGEAIYSIC